jgi:Protein of unknown function (DUF3631)
VALYRVFRLVKAEGREETFKMAKQPGRREKPPWVVPPIVIVDDEEKVAFFKRWKVPAVLASEVGKLNGQLAGRDVVLLIPNDDRIDEIGKALIGQAGRICVVTLADDWDGTGAEFRSLVDQAPDWVEADVAAEGETAPRFVTNRQWLLDELARLPDMEYEERRKDAAADLNVRRPVLDRARDERREELEREAANRVPPEHGHWVVIPWEEPVDGAELLAALVRRIRRHIVITEYQAVAIALWIMFAWAHEVAVYSPLLHITSAVPNEGKTQLLGLVSFLTPRGYLFTEPTVAGIYQEIDRKDPTACVDDADSLFGPKLVAIINASWTKSTARKLIGDNHGKGRSYSIWCPKAFGMIGRKLPAATLSRCITIPTKRKLPFEQVEDFRQADDAELGELRRKCLRWTNDNMSTLKVAAAELPKQFQNRLGNNWELQFAVAHVVGGGWPVLAQQAAVAVNAAHTEDDEADRIKVVADIVYVFKAKGVTRIHSDSLTTALRSLEGRPWGNWKGRGLSKWQLADLLCGFNPPIKPIHSMRIGTEVAGGYELRQFDEVRARYLDDAEHLAMYLAELKK